MKTRFLLTLTSLSLLCGSILGCDETIRTTIIDGLETGATDVATALITALFLSIQGGLDIPAAMLDSAGTLSSLLY